jgi:hypothetical protein
VASNSAHAPSPNSHDFRLSQLARRIRSPRPTAPGFR